MSSIRENKGLLFFDFRYQGKRHREYTKLSDTPANRKKMQKVLDKIEQEIATGAFDFDRYFPGSRQSKEVGPAKARRAPSSQAQRVPSRTPIYKLYVEDWFQEQAIGWRRSHQATVRSTLDRHLIPAFGNTQVENISKADALKFRASLAKIKGRNGNKSLSTKTINRIMQVLIQSLDEAADRYGFNNPVAKIKRLKQQRADIQPFSAEEVQKIITTIRPDYRDYMIVRMYTGMRTGEIHGLKIKYLDFERRQILVRETIVRGEVEYTKTDGSQREIDMSAPVYDALKRQVEGNKDRSEYVFCNLEGLPIDVDNFTNRVWYPLLRHLGLEKRRPYETRHTAATLWLGVGENPEWVARQLGHTDTTMLFRVYSRFIPNLTRRDGSAFDRFVTSALIESNSNNQEEEAA